MKKNDTCFCINCCHDVLYSVTSDRVEITIRGVRFSYVELSACCKECGEEIYIPEINDTNVDAREDAYRKAKRLINISEIQDILNKYNIGAGPLAKLLEFGEVTINRYLLGSLPSQEHSEQLLRLKYNHKLMERLLEEKKDYISAVAYTKCRKALDQLNELYGQKKIDLVARYFLTKAEDITSLALQKLLYYAQAFYQALFNEVLFDDDCQAWARGPVFPEVYYKYKDYGYDPINKPLEKFENDLNELTIKEIDFLDIIISTFGCYSGKVLSVMTHSEKPWIEARGSLQPEDRSITVINRSAINEYFNDIINKYNIVNPCDILKYSNDLYEKVNSKICQ